MTEQKTYPPLPPSRYETTGDVKDINTFTTNDLIAYYRVKEPNYSDMIEALRAAGYEVIAPVTIDDVEPERTAPEEAAALKAAPVEQGDSPDAARYRWLRDAESDVSLVIDQMRAYYDLGRDMQAQAAPAQPPEPSKCKCTFAQKMVGDGCRYCNPQEYIDRLHEALEVEDRGPLTNEQIDDIWVEHGCEGEDANAFARAIEAAHGIGIGIKKEDSNDQ